ncbi:hypothetical protein TSUD_358590 [Trifolium subterraneum]|uniref:Potassium transporter n=1 Tax=Trifolium subterraneum TaxID=3900 RepID=A0A2Z6N863_TRISU|nr:hypothetical protein TSUD_358590 [Trifolium subterraneum]
MSTDEANSIGMEEETIETSVEERNTSSPKLRHRCLNSLNVEAGRVSNITDDHSSKLSWMATLSLAFQSLGVVYGDIGTSPLYVFASTFTNGIDHSDDILAVLSLIYYTILVFPLLKYVFIVLWANDNGNGCEAMFADLGHFSVRAIQISFSFITLPAILAAYSGQAAYLRKFPHTVSNIFYECIPGPLYWPTFVIAVIASIIASQAIVSGAFSIVSQALSMGCFPRVKVVHTSATHEGQVYIPAINYMFLVACIAVTILFRTSEKLSNAYGVAIVCDMTITTFLVSVVMLIVWKKNIWQVALFFIPFGCIELLYLSSQMVKFKEGGFLPLVFAIIFTMIMGIWFYAQKERYMFELKNKVSSENLIKLVNDLNTKRIHGIGILYSELVQGVPPIFAHFIANIPSIHSVVVFVSIKAIPISNVALEERFLFRYVEPRECKIFRCIVRHGYNDVIGDSIEFESQLVQYLKDFIIQESNYMSDHETTTMCEQVHNKEVKALTLSCGTLDSIQSSGLVEGIENEIKFIDKALEKGVVYMLGEIEVVANPKSSILNKIIVNTYNFLRRNSQQRDELMAIPRRRLLKVGMTYEI